MAERFQIVGTEEIPNIILDAENGIFEITGRSFPENVERLFTPIIEWLKEYITDPNPTTDFKFQLEYFNSSSAKFLYDIFLELKRLDAVKIPVLVEWIYDQEDPDLLEAGQDIASLVDMIFVFVPKSK